MFATSVSAMVLQLLGLLVRPSLLAVGFVPALVTFELAARRLSALELLLLGPGWLACVLLVTMAAAVVLVRLGRAPRPGRQADLWSPSYFRWLLAPRPSAPSRPSWESCEGPVRSRRSTGSAARGSGGRFAWSPWRSTT